MFSLKDIFSAQIGDDFVFQEPNSRALEISPYLPTEDIHTLTPLSVESLPRNENQMVSQRMPHVLNETNPMLLFPINNEQSRRIDSHQVFDDSVSETMILNSGQMDRSESYDDIRKHNHSEIEKRRREKMNLHIKDLAQLVPMCNAMPSSRKLDKLTVLRMTVQHIKAVKSSEALSDSVNQTPSFISEDIIDKMLLQMTEGFLFVVSCDRGKILHVSDSVKQTLNYSQRDLLGISWFDVLHPKDIPKVKEQLSLWDIAPKEKLIDSKTLLPLDANMIPTTCTRIQACPGARRSFFCRMKYKSYLTKKDESGIKGFKLKKRRRVHIMNEKYCDLYCMGYLKSFTPMNHSNEALDCENQDNINTGCLVAMARVMPHNSIPSRESASSHNFPVRPIEYTSRHAMDGLYLFVDQRVTPILGYLPQEMLGTSCYDYCHPDDVKTLAENHRTALQHSGKKTSNPFRFKTKIGTYIYLKSIWKTFKNPWTREFEYIIAINENVAIPDSDSIKTNNTSVSIIFNENNTNKKNKESNKETKDLNSSEIERKSNIKNSSKYENQSLCSSNASSDDTLPSSSDSHKSLTASDISFMLSSPNSIMKHFMNTKVKHSKVGQQIAEEILETQRRADDFSSSSSQSSNSPPSSLDTGNGSVSSSSIDKPNHMTYNHMKTPQSISSSITSDSGIDNRNYDSLSYSSERDLTTSAVSENSSCLGTMNNMRFQNSNQNNFNNVDNHVINNQYNSQYNNHTIFNHNASQQNDINEESDEAAMALIMSILEADAGLGGPVDFSGMPWPLY